jgi:hypothetical protein
VYEASYQKYHNQPQLTLPLGCEQCKLQVAASTDCLFLLVEGHSVT